MELSPLYYDIIVPNMVFTNIFLLVAFYFIYRYYYKIQLEIALQRKLSMLLTKEQRVILIKYFPFYRTLSPSLRQEFEQRVIHFMYTKEYEAISPLVLTEKMGVLTAAYAAQLTFGLRDFTFNHLKKVVIYPEKFYSEKFGRYKSWEIKQHGVLNYSWKHFYKELRNRKTISPIGLRIMANAIKLENQRLKQANKNPDYEPKIIDAPEYAAVKKKKKSIFTERDLATKENYLVACLVYFFSRPVEFKNQYPSLYAYYDSKLYQGVKQNLTTQ